MKNYGFIRIASACPLGRVGDVMYNTTEICNLIDQAVNQQVSLLVFPELSISSYTCGDLLLTSAMKNGVEQAISTIQQHTLEKPITVFVGAPIYESAKLYNCAVVISSGEIKGVIPKTHLPNHGEFYEQRWFDSAKEFCGDSTMLCGEIIPMGTDLLFTMEEAVIAAEICEDMWVDAPPSIDHVKAGANIICNLSASNAVIGKQNYRRMLVKQRSFSSHCAYVFSSAGICESTTDTLYSGHLLIGENGNILADASQMEFENLLLTADVDLERLSCDRLKSTTFHLSKSYRSIPLNHKICSIDQLQRHISQTPFIPASKQNKSERMEEIYHIQALSLAKRLRHTGLKHPVIGISGGLDSTLALLVTVRAMDKLGWDRKNILGITMPGFGTTGRTNSNSKKLMDALGITSKEIDITQACRKHFEDIGHDPSIHDVTYENVQARERTQILLDIANKHGGLVVGTGDLSELALGWATYAGDHISMYGVNAGVPKTLVRHIVAWTGEQMGGEIQKILEDILDTPVSPELLPADKDGKIAQKTEEIIGDYILHDFFLYYFVRFGFTFDKIYYLAKHAFGDTYPKEQIVKCLTTFGKRFFAQQFKRSCLPDGPKIGSVTLSPRADWRMPSDACAALWMQDFDQMD
ncbi:NAD(+) synthase [Massilioclostridium coli]|uniref:NAD(+) synthase n=1 Tax=Massilioclostridium coli TaxID=1870991 RepID=UPI00085C1E50|nr:NAD(+) synthase [Massilioclostridium coli]